MYISPDKHRFNAHGVITRVYRDSYYLCFDDERETNLSISFIDNNSELLPDPNDLLKEIL